MTNAISIKGLDKSIGNTVIYKDFDFDVKEKRITAIFGPNGAGKSTLLNILSGVLVKDAGEIQVVNSNSFEISYVFQNYRESLLPWRTNYENLALPLQIQKMSDVKIKKKIEKIRRMFEFSCDWNGYPYQLSGGQQQILAFMRSLITNPKLLLIDEPFSALDYENNLRLRGHLQKYFLAFKPTVLLITHNIEEAVHLAHEVVVLSKKPTLVIEVIDNPLRFPRDLQSLKSEEFHKVKDKVLSVFQKASNL